MSGAADLLMALMSRSGIVTLSGEAIVGAATALLIFRSDGTTDKTQDVTTSQINAGTDWIIPNSAGAVPGYTVRFEVASGDTPTTGVLDTDIALTIDTTVGFSSDFPKACTLTVTLKHNGFTIATGSYSLATG